MGIPFHQLDHQLDLLLVADRGDADEVLDVDDPQAANLHVMPDDRIPGAVKATRLAAHHVDDVIGDQAMPSHHQVEGDLALADAALAQQQDADSEDVQQHPVKAAHRGEPSLEQGLPLPTYTPHPT